MGLSGFDRLHAKINKYYLVYVLSSQVCCMSDIVMSLKVTNFNQHQYHGNMATTTTTTTTTSPDNNDNDDNKPRQRARAQMMRKSPNNTSLESGVIPVSFFSFIMFFNSNKCFTVYTSTQYKAVTTSDYSSIVDSRFRMFKCFIEPD